MADEQRGIPVRIRIGDGAEHEVGTFNVPEGLPALLRMCADRLEANGSLNWSVVAEQPSDR